MTDVAKFEISRVLNDIGQTAGGIARPMAPAVIALIFAPQLVAGLVQVVFGRVTGTAVALTGVIGIIAGVLEIIANIALIFASVNFLNGQPTSMEEAFRRGSQKFLRVFLVSLLVGLGVIAGAIFFVIPGLFLAVAWCATVPILVMESGPAIDAIGRSFRLTDSCRWPIVGVFLVLICVYLVGLLIVGIASFVFTLVGLTFLGPVLLVPALTAIAIVVSAATSSAIYHELIRIKEGGGSTVADVFV